MLNKSNIKQILKEEINKTTQKRFSEGVLKYAYNKIYNHLKKDEGANTDIWPGETYDYFINYIKNKINSGKRLEESINYILDIIVRYSKELMYEVDPKKYIKWLLEYIVNYGGGNTEYIVEEDKDLWYYLRENKYLFRCEDSFFEFIWDKYLNQWGDNTKDRLWDDISYEVEEKIEDEEWQEENGVTFDGLDREKSYFMSYWHYPMDSLGWRRDRLCDFYVDIIGDDDNFEKIFKYYGSKNINKVFIGDTFYVVMNKNLFYN